LVLAAVATWLIPPQEARWRRSVRVSITLAALVQLTLTAIAWMRAAP